MNHFFFFKCRESVLRGKYHFSVAQIPHQIVIFWAVTKDRNLDWIKTNVVVLLEGGDTEGRPGQPALWAEDTRPCTGGPGSERSAASLCSTGPRGSTVPAQGLDLGEPGSNALREAGSSSDTGAGCLIWVKLSSFQSEHPPPSVSLHFSSQMGRMEENWLK